MNVHIVTVSHDNDLEWLKYSIHSIQKFCKGYTGHTIILDTHENDCVKTKDYLDSINYPYVIDERAKDIKVGYIRQQYMKCVADQYLPEDTDFICHVDSDSIFFEEHTPEIYFLHDSKRPDMLITKYEDMGMKHAWQPITEAFMKESLEYEYMRRMPLLYSPKVMNGFRDFVQKTHGCDIFDYLKDLERFTEYNAIGAVAHKFYNDDYIWIDTHQSAFTNLPLLQSWSHSNIDDKRILLESLITYPERHIAIKNKLEELEKEKRIPHGCPPPGRLDYRSEVILDMYTVEMEKKRSPLDW